MPGSMTQQQTRIIYTIFPKTDLNWENPNLRNEVYDIMRFGLTKESMVLEWMLFNLFQRQQLSELPKRNKTNL
jgi:hypothetical protein